jgi:hypothetical protein
LAMAFSVLIEVGQLYHAPWIDTIRRTTWGGLVLGFDLALPRASSWTIGLLAMAFSVSIEVSQLYHAPWIDSIRHTTLGGLILGYGFLWGDLACYAMGVGLGVVIEYGASFVARRRR